LDSLSGNDFFKKVKPIFHLIVLTYRSFTHL